MKSIYISFYLLFLVVFATLGACTSHGNYYPVKGVGDVGFAPEPQSQLPSGYLVVVAKDQHGWYVKKVMNKPAFGLKKDGGMDYFYGTGTIDINNGQNKFRAGFGYKIPGREAGDEVLYVDSNYLRVQPYFETYILGRMLYDYVCYSHSAGYDPCGETVLVNHHMQGAADINPKMMVKILEEAKVFDEVRFAQVNGETEEPTPGARSIAQNKLILLPVEGEGLADIDREFYRSAVAEVLGKRYKVVFGEPVDKALEDSFSSHLTDEGTLKCDAKDCYFELARRFKVGMVAKVTINAKGKEHLMTVAIYNVVGNRAEKTKSGVCRKCDAGAVRDALIALAR